MEGIEFVPSIYRVPGKTCRHIICIHKERSAVLYQVMIELNVRYGPISGNTGWKTAAALGSVRVEVGAAVRGRGQNREVTKRIYMVIKLRETKKTKV